jgi:hypothetical protein
MHGFLLDPLLRGSVLGDSLDSLSSPGVLRQECLQYSNSGVLTNLILTTEARLKSEVRRKKGKVRRKKSDFGVLAIFDPLSSIFEGFLRALRVSVGSIKFVKALDRVSGFC